VIVAALGLAAGTALFVTTFGAIFTGFVPAIVVAALGYPIIAAVLARMKPVPTWLPAAAMAAPALPFAAQFAVALLVEDGVIAALVWPAIAAAMFGLALGGAYVGRRRAS